MSAAAFSPAPAAVGCDAGARRHRLVRDGGVTVATAILEEDARLDDAFTVGAGNVEGQTGTCVTPDRNSMQVEGEMWGFFSTILSSSFAFSW